MSDGETISEMFTSFTEVVNSLKALGKNLLNTELVKKIQHFQRAGNQR